MYGMVSSQSHTKSSRRRQIQSSTLATTDIQENDDTKQKSIYRRCISCIRQTWTGVKSSMGKDAFINSRGHFVTIR